MNPKTVVLDFLVLVFLVLGCTSVDLSTPEKNYESFYAAIKAKNFDNFSKCFDTDVGLYNKKGLRILADKVFNDFDIVSHGIAKKEITGKNKVSFVAEEIWQRRNGVRAKVTFRIDYVNSGGIWKIVSSETLSLENLKDKSM